VLGDKGQDRLYDGLIISPKKSGAATSLPIPQLHIAGSIPVARTKTPKF